MGKLLRNCKRHNPSAKILSGRIGIRSDLKEMMEAEAQLWGMSRAEYTNKLFQHFFCELAPLERYNALNPSRFNEKDYENNATDQVKISNDYIVKNWIEDIEGGISCHVDDLKRAIKYFEKAKEDANFIMKRLEEND